MIRTGTAEVDKFKTIQNSVTAGTIPLPLLLSSGEFPVRFGRYEIVDILGDGEMGSVFLARDTRLNRQVAIKIPKLCYKRKSVDRFRREARIMSNLRHPNICPCYDAGEFGGVRYFAMAYIEGETLAKCLDREAPFTSRRAAILVRKLALALETAHRSGVIHRDLKPANIVINEAGEPVIMDFGLARSEDGGSIVTKNGVMLGTPAYMPPEQVMGHCELIGPPSDLYSLGVVMYQMLVGRVPFDGTLIRVLKQIISNEPPPPSHFNPAVDRQLEAVCLKAMAKNIDRRFSSAIGFADALRDCFLTRDPS